MPAIIDGTNGVTTPNVLTSSSGVALTLQSSGTTAVTIDTSQNVGIGTASPSNPLHVVGAIRTSSGANYAQFSNNFLRSNASGSFFYDNATVGQSNEFRTSVSSSLDTTALTLTASGILALRNAATNATGIGITFPATQSASSDANTLDDYEEGTFTPTVTSNSGTITAYTASGYYVKVGRTITITMFAIITTPGSAGGVLNFAGLPFTSFNPSFGAGNRASTSAWREDNNTGYFYFGYVTGNATTGVITSSTNGAVSWSASAAYVSSFVYETAS
jgi:hypothetical protein